MRLQEGDVITSVDDVPLAALTLQQGVERLRGETGTAVHIEYVRDEVREDLADPCSGSNPQCTLDRSR